MKAPCKLSLVSGFVWRWAATPLLATEDHFGRIIGYQELWTLKAALNEPGTHKEIAVA